MELDEVGGEVAAGMKYLSCKTTQGSSGQKIVLYNNLSIIRLGNFELHFKELCFVSMRTVTVTVSYVVCLYCQLLSALLQIVIIVLAPFSFSWLFFLIFVRKVSQAHVYLSPSERWRNSGNFQMEPICTCLRLRETKGVVPRPPYLTTPHACY